VVVVLGEPGIGKSRLLQRFREQISATQHIWIEAAATPFFQNSPFYTVAEMLRELLALRNKLDESLAQLESRVMQAGLKPAEALPLIAPLLDLPARYAPSSLSPEEQRRRLLWRKHGGAAAFSSSKSLSTRKAYSMNSLSSQRIAGSGMIWVPSTGATAPIGSPVALLISST